MIIVRICLFMTSYAGEYSVITGAWMALNAIVPLIFMFATVNRKILPVMVECCRCPSRICGMAGRTVGREMGSYVVWIRGLIVIILMARHTLRRCIRIITGLMARFTIIYIVSEA